MGSNPYRYYVNRTAWMDTSRVGYQVTSVPSFATVSRHRFRWAAEHKRRKLDRRLRRRRRWDY